MKAGYGSIHHFISVMIAGYSKSNSRTLSGLSHGQELRGAGHHSFHRRNPFHGANGFTKREFVLKLTGEGEKPEYPNYVALELLKDKCALMDNYRIGDEIKVTFNLSGRSGAKPGNPEKCFTSLQAWRIEGAGSGGADEYCKPCPITTPRPMTTMCLSEERLF